MLDKRCKYKTRETNQFYLFIKYPKTRIYYAKYPAYNTVKSTGETTIKEAYKKACWMFEKLGVPKNIPKINACVLRYLSDVKDITRLTSARVNRMQEELQKKGVSNKTIMNYCYILKKALKDYVDLQFKLLPIRNKPYGCFPISSFYGFHKWVMDFKTKLVFFVMVTGCRLSEIETCELVERNGRKYIKINGTKTENAVREVPAIPEAIEILKDVKKRITNKRIYKEATIKAGAFCGFTPEYIDENYIVFHSFRKMYKTLLVSCNVSNVYVEYLMGHSMTTNVDRLYFRPEAMDDAEYYKTVTEALKRFL